MPSLIGCYWYVVLSSNQKWWTSCGHPRLSDMYGEWRIARSDRSLRQWWKVMKYVSLFFTNLYLSKFSHGHFWLLFYYILLQIFTLSVVLHLSLALVCILQSHHFFFFLSLCPQGRIVMAKIIEISELFLIQVKPSHSKQAVGLRGFHSYQRWNLWACFFYIYTVCITYVQPLLIHYGKWLWKLLEVILGCLWWGWLIGEL